MWETGAGDRGKVTGECDLYSGVGECSGGALVEVDGGVAGAGFSADNMWQAWQLFFIVHYISPPIHTNMFWVYMLNHFIAHHTGNGEPDTLLHLWLLWLCELSWPLTGVKFTIFELRVTCRIFNCYSYSCTLTDIAPWILKYMYKPWWIYSLSMHLFVCCVCVRVCVYTCVCMCVRVFNQRDKKCLLLN